MKKKTLVLLALVLGVLLLVAGCAKSQTAYRAPPPNPDDQYDNAIGGGCGFASAPVTDVVEKLTERATAA